MRILLAAVAAAQLWAADTPPGMRDILARVAEEAQVMEQTIPKTLTQETLEQRASMGVARFRPRVGTGANAPVRIKMQVRHIVSEYSVSTLKQSDSHDLHEFRQVISVDGKQVQSADSARHALSLGVHSQDERIRKRMLEDFAKHGLVDIATDYGLILLAFTPRGMENMAIVPGSRTNVGADLALGLAWKQKSEAGGQIEFQGRRTIRQPLQGTLWVRASDGLPLRAEVWAEYTQDQHVVRDEATVDYTESAHGFLTPASVVHRHLVDKRLITENRYRYEPFKMFSSDAEIKFTEVPEMPPEQPTAPARR
jgi:hypothetical protein